jgi:cytoskeletal protein RodZ
MSSLVILAQQANDQFTTDQYHDSLRNLIFLGVFIIVAIVVGVWWVKRYF